MELKTTEQIYRGEFKDFDEETESHHRIKWMPVDDLIKKIELLKSQPHFKGFNCPDCNVTRTRFVGDDNLCPDCAEEMIEVCFYNNLQINKAFEDVTEIKGDKAE